MTANSVADQPTPTQTDVASRRWLAGLGQPAEPRPTDMARVDRPMHPATVFPLLMALLIGVFLLNVGLGAVRIAPLQVIAILLDHLGAGGVTVWLSDTLRALGTSADLTYTRQQDAVLWSIRLPRVLLVALVGAGLATSGAALQGVFRNPLADPGLIGVTSGAALGAVGAIVLGVGAFGTATLPIFAFIGGLITTLVVYAIARGNGRTEVVTLLLTGIALNAIAGAGTGFLTYLANDAQLRNITFWTLGSAGGATWRAVTAITPFMLVGLVMIPRWGAALNLLVLGEREARHLGVSTERVRMSVITLTALMTGAAVAVAGAVGFIGLIVPHIIRLVCGPDHRTLLPASALGGAVLLLLADLVARTVAAPSELPLGVVTALGGGPFFLWLLHRARRATGGWG